MSYISNWNTMLHHEPCFFKVYDYGSFIPQLNKLFCDVRISSQLFQHKIQSDISLLCSFQNFLRIVYQHIHVNQIGIWHDLTALMKCKRCFYQLPVSFHCLLYKHAFPLSIASFKILITVSLPARKGLIRIIRCSKVGSAFLKVPEIL